MTSIHAHTLKSIRPGMALAALFGWLLSFPMFGRLLLETAGERSLTLGLTFVGIHATSMLILHKYSSTDTTEITTIRVASLAIAILTVLYSLFSSHFIIGLFIIMMLGIASAYLILHWATWFITSAQPLLNLAIAMAGANVVCAIINIPWSLPQHLSFFLLAALALGGSWVLPLSTNTIVIRGSAIRRDSVKTIRALGAFIIAIYFVGGIWYQTVAMQFSIAPDWGVSISTLLYASGIIFLAWLATHGQPGNLALFSITALGIGLLMNLTGFDGVLPMLVYYVALNFGLAAADLFFWYVLWVLGRLYGGRRVYGIGLGFSLLLIASSVAISSTGWANSSPALLYIMALTLLFLAVPLVFRYPFKIVDVPPNQFKEKTTESEVLAEMLTPPEILTPQEQQIYVLLMHGATNDEIATTMFISIHTVKFHVRNTLRKLDVKNRKELLARYFVDK
ncbi:MAG: helix-turn-helix transcriptional regulator [Firmicutes bacterium]|nr:helix-turn-helix transcriptional regulator [Bacillota bacterium]